MQLLSGLFVSGTMTACARMNSFAAVILAAGRSRRMKHPKLLLPWGDTTILGHHVRVWKSLGARQIGIIIAGSDKGLEQELSKPEYQDIDVIINPFPESEVFHSLLYASGWTGWKPDLTHWVAVMGDQPHIPTSILVELLEFTRRHENKICRPRHQGYPRHPIVFPGWAWPQLRLMPNYRSLTEFLVEHQPACEYFDCGEPALSQDIDFPADYLRMSSLMPQPPTDTTHND